LKIANIIQQISAILTFSAGIRRYALQAVIWTVGGYLSKALEVSLLRNAALSYSVQNTEIGLIAT